MPDPGHLLVDLAPAQEVMRAVEGLEEAWARCPPRLRRKLARLLWLHERGEVVPYRPPQDDENEGSMT